MAFFLVSLLLTAVFFVLSAVFRPKVNTENAKPGSLGDFDFPTATEVLHIPICWGTVQIPGSNVIWYGDFRQNRIRVRSGGGLFSNGRRQTVGFRYFIGIQFALCRGPIDFLRRIWVGDKLVFGSPIGGASGNGTIVIDEPTIFGGDTLGQGGVEGTLRLFNGSATQPVSSYLQPFQNVGGNQTAYRDTAFVAPDVDPPYIGNSTSLKQWKFEVQRIPQGTVSNGLPGGETPVLDPANAEISNLPGLGIDANPIFVIFEILTAPYLEARIGVSEIDVTNFDEAAKIIKDEGNGFSLQLDNPRDAQDVIALIEEQIDGVLFQDPVDGLYKINLARPDQRYTDSGVTVPALLPTIDENNIVEISQFSRGTWRDTTNTVDAAYTDRVQNYSDKYGKAQDMGNVAIQGGRIVQSELRFPGVKDRITANNIAWRELRVLAYPIAKLTVVVDRTLYQAQPGRVVPFTLDINGESFVERRMRIIRVDFAEITDDRITLEIAEDIFEFDDGSFGAPPVSAFVPPTDALIPFTAGDEVRFEAPRKFVDLDIDSSPEDDKLFADAQSVSVEVGFNILTSVMGSPFAESGQSLDFALIGDLLNDLDVGSAYPLATLDLDLVSSVTDSAAVVEAFFAQEASTSEQGINLVNLIMVGNADGSREFMTCTMAVDIGGDIVRLSGVSRGLMDTPQRYHVSGAKVFMLSGVLTAATFNPGDVVTVKLQPISSSDQVDEMVITGLPITMADRVRRPYPPSQMDLNGNPWDNGAAVSLDLNGGPDDARGILIELLRRDFRINNEIDQLGVDAATIVGDFPAANSTEHTLDVTEDPDVTPTVILTGLDFAGGTSLTVLRNEILAQTAGVVPSRLRFEVEANHTFEMTSFTSRNKLLFDFDVESPQLAGLFNFGSLPISTTSATYTAAAAGVFTLDLDSALPGSGIVEYQINGGGFVTGIGAGLTTGTIPGVAVNDTVEVRHTATTGATTQMLRLTDPAPSSAFVAYAILTN